MKVDKNNVEDVYPMSDVSKGMIYHSLKDVSSHTFHEQSVRFLEINNFSKDNFERTIDLLVKRHEMLRSVFNVFDYKEAVQIVLKEVEKDIDYLDISDKPEEEQQAYLRDWLKEDLETPFNLKEMRPLWRVRLFLLSPNTVCFIWIAHHAISEGWSAASILTEINNTYIQLLKNPDYKPPKLKSSYKSFVLEQMEIKRNPENYDFWKKKLYGCEKTDLSFFNYSEEAIKNSSFITKQYDFGEALRDDLNALAEAQKTSLKNLCFTAYVFTLFYFSRQNDIVFGLLANNRPATEDGDKLFGCFLNTLPFRFSVKPGTTWHDLSSEIHQEMNQYLRYGGLSLIEILNTIGYVNEDNHNPLFDTMFNYIDFHIYDDLVNEIEKPSHDLSGFRQNVKGVQKDNYFITFMINPRNGFKCEFLHYNPIITDHQADAIMDIFKRVLHKLAYHGDELALKQSLFTGEEDRLINSCINKDYPLNSTVYRCISNQVAQTPDRTAICFNGETLTYQDLEKRVKELAGCLQEQGLNSSEKVVGIYLDRSLESVVAILAAVYAGASYLPLGTHLPEKRIQFMVDDSKCTHVISDVAHRNTIPAGVDYIDINNRGVWNIPGTSPESLLYTIYTSGSTGQPKGVMVNHSNVINLIHGLNDIIYSQYDTHLSFGLVSPFDFDASVQHLYGALMLGHTLHIVPEVIRSNGDELVDFYNNENINVSDGTPTHLRLIMESGKSLPESLKHFLIAGEVLPVTLLQQFYQRHQAQITNLYGPTETCVDSTFYHVEPERLNNMESVPIGKPLPNEKIYVINSDGQLQGVGVPGEIVIDGAGVSLGYRNLDHMPSKFVPSRSDAAKFMYKTGDIGRWLPDGNIEFLGRIDDQVKLRGYRIELGEIEKAVLSISGVTGAVVIVEETEEDQILCCYFTTLQNVSANEIRNALSQFLPEYMVPQRIEHLQKIPVKSNGKVDKNQLKNISTEVSPAKVKPNTKIESTILDIWADALEINKSKIGVYDEFMQLGGHSLRLMKVLANIQKEFNVKIKLRDILKQNTIKLQASIVQEAGKLKFIPLQKQDGKPFYPLTQAQLNIYLFQIKNTGSIIYNMPQLFEFTEEPDKDKLERVFKKIIDRHEVLRASFSEHEGNPVQTVLTTEDTKFSVEYYNIAKESETTVKEVFHSFIRPFDLENDCLFRVGVAKSNDKYFLLVDQHHIISDRRSNEILAQEFSMLYHDQQLAEPKWQYNDYINWLQLDIVREQLAEQEKYWLERFNQAPKILELPVNEDVEPHLHNDVKSRKFKVDGESFGLVKKLCADYKVSTFNFVMSVYSIVLYKLTNVEDISVAVPLSGRSHADLHEIVGNFVNITVLRNYISPEIKFSDFLKETNSNIFDAFDNQYYEIDKLIEKLSTQHQYDFNRLLDIAFDLLESDNTQEKQPEINEFIRPSGLLERKTTPYLLLLVGHSVDDQIIFNLDYKVNLLSESFISYFIDSFNDVLDTVLGNPDVPVQNIKLSDVLAESKPIYSDGVGDFNF